MLRKIRIVLALVFFVGITLLFLDFSGLAQTWWGWMAKIQFLPAVLALNVGVVIALVLLTLVFGRVYCSVICPLGVFQDFFNHLSARRKKHRFRLRYAKAHNILRYIMLGVFVLAVIFGIGSVMALLAPYSTYGIIAQNLFAPVWAWGNNLLAALAERVDSYAFHRTDIWIRNVALFVTACVLFVVLAVLAWRKGRLYCNTICPVGTVLGFLSRYAWFKPVINTSKCVNCGLCARQCKAQCIDAARHEVDYSRCVGCMDCIDQCHEKAITFSHPEKQPKTATEAVPDKGRRNFLVATAALGGSALAQAHEKTVDGGLAVILDKKAPHRHTRIVPPGAVGLWHMERHCVGCQLCVANCPNGVLRPSSDFKTFMQPESSYERGYCRPECTKCSEVCPAGAFHPISKAEKASIQIGHAVWVKENCLPLAKGVDCGNCARHCPSGAIQMVPSVAGDPFSPKIPVVNEARCIGCGACENLCPSRPFSAIYVEGNEIHRTL